MVGSSCRETVIWGEVFLDRADQLWTDLDEIKQTLSLDKGYASKRDVEVVLSKVEKAQSLLVTLLDKRHQVTTNNQQMLLDNQVEIMDQIGSVKRYIGIYCG